MDISPFIAKASNAFLPAIVFQLEEHGLPRMIAKQIHESGVVDLESAEQSLHDVIYRFNAMGLQGVLEVTPALTQFDKYILEYFYDGITKKIA